MGPDVSQEISRIEEAYRRRDSAGAGTQYSFSNPAYVLYIQAVERATLSILRESSVDLTQARVLDVGCGSGYFLHRLVEYGAREAAGIDLMENRVAEALLRYPTLEVRQGDATALPFADGAFDLVTQYTALSSVLHPDVRARIGAEMHRVTAPGGTVLSFDIRSPSASVRGLKALLRTAMRLRGRPPADDATPIQSVPLEELTRVLRLEPLAARSTILQPEVASVARSSPLFTQMLSRIAPLRTHLIATFRKA
jgi:ubiquinone/menaquinone biosynthesis C-methylase UbiE